MKKLIVTIFFLAVIVVSSFGDQSYRIIINGVDTKEDAIILNGKWYVSLNTIDQFSEYKVSHNDGLITLTSSNNDDFSTYKVINYSSNDYEIEFNNGYVYIGKFSNGKMNGLGTLYASEGSSYYGEWKNNEAVGKEILISFSNSNYYIGEIKNLAPNGYGKMTYSNGDVYTGDFVYGHRDGRGIMIYNTGDTYKGHWKNDLFNGVGRFTNNGQAKQGEWINNKYIKYIPTTEFDLRY